MKRNCLGTGEAENSKMLCFKILHAITQFTGFLMMFMMVNLIYHYLKGFNWRDNPEIQFNWHPFAMTFGIFISGNAILMYREYSHVSIRYINILHATLQLITFVFYVFALIAVFYSRNQNKSVKRNLYTLHSWLGIGAVVIHIGNLLFSFIIYLYPKKDIKIRKFFMPYHIYFGLTQFTLAVSVSLIGLTEKAMFTVKDHYSELPNDAQLINCCGVLLVIYCSLILFLATLPKFRRPPISEEPIVN